MEEIELAFLDYAKGMKYKEIAEKYEVSLATVKGWATRNSWTKKKSEEIKEDKFFLIKESLLNQLKENNSTELHYKDLVNDYMSFWKIKNNLIADVEKRGVSVPWSNGKVQSGYKKNESISELLKTNAQMLKILNELNLKPIAFKEDDEDYEI